MSEYGVTEKGFVIKRLDRILEEIHSDLTDGFKINTNLSETSFLNVLVTTFASQIASLWETAQESYYAKYPASATGINLENAIQYGGISRKPSKQSCYPLHCTGIDGTSVRSGTVVSTYTNPEVRLYADGTFLITRSSFNSVSIKVAVEQSNEVYTVSINGTQYSYSNVSGTEEDILNGLKDAIKLDDYIVKVSEGLLIIEDTVKTRKNTMVLSENLTTGTVTSIANFLTEEYGKVMLPHGIVTKIVNNISGFQKVTNLITPVYGRNMETDVELRQAYIAKSALRSNTMIDSIVSELSNNVPDVESASGYENDSDIVDSRGLPPHSIEIVVEGGDNSDIAEAILRRKAGGIQTYGKISVDVPGAYGDSIPIRFNRPEYLYAWLKVVLHGENNKIPKNYVRLTTDSIKDDSAQLKAGNSLLTQLLHDGIYGAVAGVQYIDIYTAYGDKSFVPSDSDYNLANIIVTTRQKVLIDEERIEVLFHADS